MGESAKIATKAPEAKRENPVSQTRKPERSQSMNSPIDRILFLQKTIGNQAVRRMMKSGAFQAKLRIGQPNDKYEQEADRVADQVMRMSELRAQRQPEEEEEEEEGLIQPRPLAEQITPLVQRQIEPEEEEEEPIQTKALSEQITPLVQRQEEEEKEEEEPIQTKVLSEQITPLIQRQEEEEEEEATLQTKGVTGKLLKASNSLENRTNSIKGGGTQMPDNLRAYFEQRFGYNFGQVRLHTDTNATESARALNAKAFTIGNNIVFGSGYYSPETINGQRLLAHELTHVIQQTIRNSQSSYKLQRAVKFKANFDNINVRPRTAAAISGNDFTYEDAEFSADAKIEALGDSVADLNQWDIGILQDMTVNWEREYWQRGNTDRRGRFVEQKYKLINKRLRDQADGATTVWSDDSEHKLLSSLAAVPAGGKFKVSTTIHTSDYPGGEDTIHGSSVPGMDASDGTHNISIQRIGTRFDTWISARNTAANTWRHLRRINWNYQRSLDFTGRGATLSIGKETAKVGKHGPYGAGRNAPLTSSTTANAAMSNNANWYRRRVKGWT